MGITNPFGYYGFQEIFVGENYIFSVSHKLHRFENSSQVQFINEDNFNIKFIALPANISTKRN